eukprot:sb/3461372/
MEENDKISTEGAESKQLPIENDPLCCCICGLRPGDLSNLFRSWLHLHTFKDDWKQFAKTASTGITFGDYICSDHFSRKAYFGLKKLQLKKNAFPDPKLLRAGAHSSGNRQENRKLTIASEVDQELPPSKKPKLKEPLQKKESTPKQIIDLKQPTNHDNYDSPSSSTVDWDAIELNIVEEHKTDSNKTDNSVYFRSSMFLVDGKHRWDCPLCRLSIRFKKRQALVRHLTSAHGTDGICRICGNSYTSLTVMMEHMFLEHTDDMTMTCCGIECYTPIELSRHISIHHYDPPQELFYHLTCFFNLTTQQTVLCSTGFTYRTNLYQHLRFVHDIAVEDVFKVAIAFNMLHYKQAMNHFPKVAHPTLRSWWNSQCRVTCKDVMLPIFVIPGGEYQPIESMKGVQRIGVELLVNFLTPLVDLGLSSVLLFGVVEEGEKDEQASAADSENSPVIAAVRLINECFPEVLVACDVCMCDYSSNGHCGYTNPNGQIQLEASVARIAEMSVNYAKAGADIVAPSDMMDNRIAAIKSALRREGLTSTAVMSYSTKYASSMYGPFRDACQSAPDHFSRKAYFGLKKLQLKKNAFPDPKLLRAGAHSSGNRQENRKLTIASEVDQELPPSKKPKLKEPLQKKESTPKQIIDLKQPTNHDNYDSPSSSTVDWDAIELNIVEEHKTDSNKTDNSVYFRSSMFLVDGKHRWDCPLCRLSIRFKKRQALVRHLTSAHGTDGICRICGNSYTSLTVMMEHMFLEHTDDMTMTCCGIECYTPIELSRHISIHHYDPPQENKMVECTKKLDWCVVCQLCSTGFTYRTNLYQHLRFVHDIAVEDVFKVAIAFNMLHYKQDCGEQLLGLSSVLLFGVVEEGEKDEQASAADSENSPVIAAVRLINECFPEVLVACDVCMCDYSSNGHCGYTNPNGQIQLEASVARIAEMSVNYAKAGADIVAPSDMMDNRIAAIKSALRREGLTSTAVMSYSTKFASSMYGPFRDACQSAPKFGDRKCYQLPPGGAGLGCLNADRDVEEGADILMVKPGQFYLDVVRRVKDSHPNYLLAVYQVSGEYVMVRNYAESSGKYEQVVIESVCSLKRAGADIIISYFTPKLLEMMSKQNGVLSL